MKNILSLQRLVSFGHEGFENPEDSKVSACCGSDSTVSVKCNGQEIIS